METRKYAKLVPAKSSEIHKKLETHTRNSKEVFKEPQFHANILVPAILNLSTAVRLIQLNICRREFDSFSTITLLLIMLCY